MGLVASMHITQVKCETKGKYYWERAIGAIHGMGYSQDEVGQAKNLPVWVLSFVLWGRGRGAGTKNAINAYI